MNKLLLGLLISSVLISILFIPSAYAADGADWTISIDPDYTQVGNDGYLRVKVDFYPSPGSDSWDTFYLQDPLTGEWRITPALSVVHIVPETIKREQMDSFIKSTYNADVIATIDDNIERKDSAHYIGPFIQSLPKLAGTKVNREASQSVDAVKRELSGLSVVGKDVGTPIELDHHSIDVGIEPADFTGVTTTTNAVFINLENPANEAGDIDTFQIRSAINLIGVIVGTYYADSGNYTCRETVYWGSVLADATRTLTGEIAVECEVGDYVGAFNPTGSSNGIEREGSGYAGVKKASGNLTNPLDNAEYEMLAGDGIALYGTSTGEITAPTITTGDETHTSSTSNFTGNVTATGEENPMVWAYWGEADGGTDSTAWSNNESLGVHDVGEFSNNATGLKGGTLYYYNFSANNTAGWAWGTSGNFTTDATVPPTLTTDVVTNFGDTWAILPGDVIDAGGENVTIRGFQWGSLAGGVFTSNWTENGNWGICSFSYNATGLDPGTGYIFRSIAYNSAGWGYSDEGTYVSVPIVVTNAVTSIEETTTTASGNITATSTNATLVFFQYDLDSGEPYSNNETLVGDYGPGQFNIPLTGLTEGTHYYGRFGAESPEGQGFGTEVEWMTKPLEPTSLTATAGYQQIGLTWTKGTGSENTTIVAKQGSYPTNRADGTTIYSSNGTSCTHSSLGDTETWYYRAWAISIDGGLSQYSDAYDQDNATTIVAPTVTTLAATDMDTDYANIGGTVDDTGGEDCSLLGLEWGTTTGVYTDNFTTFFPPLDEGTYVTSIYPANPGTRYFYRFFAINSAGRTNGTELSFLTLPEPASSFNATSYGNTWVMGGWINGTGMDWVTVRFLQGATAPSDNTTGTLVYSGNSTSGNFTGLSEGTQYTFRIFTYAYDDGAWSTADGSVTFTITTSGVAPGSSSTENPALVLARIVIPIVMVGVVILALILMATSGEILIVVLGAGIIVIFLLAMLTAINQILS